MFGSPDHYDLFNRAAPAFFNSMYRILFIDLVMDIGRFIDPAETGSFRNLSLAQVEKAVSEDTVRDRLAAHRATAEARCTPVRDYRNKVPAHFDLDIALGMQKEPPVGRRDLRESLKSIAPFLNELEQHFGIGHCAYEHTRGPSGGVAVLVRRLEKGLEMERRKRARRRGDAKTNDGRGGGEGRAASRATCGAGWARSGSGMGGVGHAVLRSGVRLPVGVCRCPGSTGSRVLPARQPTSAGLRWQPSAIGPTLR
ncbi:MAG: hypothetical protein ACRERC_06830 [Candidatus Binatia bacterium]